MAYIPLQIPPGVYKNGTEYQSKGRWNNSNLIRWYEGTIRPVGGWRKRGSTQLTGMARGIVTWRDNTGNRRIAIGTHNHLYHMNEGGSVTDISPADLVAGIPDAVLKIGYGYGTYGSYAYGVARPDLGSYTPATTWSLDTWGQYLVACSNADGRLLEWQLNTASDAAAITNAPTSCSGLVVTEERFIFALGASGNPRKIAWCDQENNTVWTAAATNQAGDFELTTVGSLMCGKRIRGSTILFTDVDVHTATYIGPPYIYGFERVGTGCGVISKQAVAATDFSHTEEQQDRTIGNYVSEVANAAGLSPRSVRDFGIRVAGQAVRTAAQYATSRGASAVAQAVGVRLPPGLPGVNYPRLTID